MCGISGCAGDLTFTEEKAMKILLKWGVVRGDDATGIGSVNRHTHKMFVAKEVDDPYFLFNTKRFDKAFNGVSKLFIGHNRSKTVGENSRENAHPFMFDDVMGAHNGTINWSSKSNLQDHASFGTDSEAIFYGIQTNGLQDTIGRIEASEAYALVWWDRRDKSLNVLRNDQRPLIYVMAKESRAIFWASEYRMLQAVLERENIKTEGEYYQFTPDWHYKWIIPDNPSEKFDKPHCVKIKNKEPRVMSGPYGYGGQDFRNHPSRNQGKKKQATFPLKNSTSSISIPDTATGVSDEELAAMMVPGYNAGADNEEHKCPEGQEWKGMFAGCQPISPPDGKVEPAVATTLIQRAINRLTGVTEEKPRVPMTVLSAFQEQKLKAYERAKIAGLVPTTDKTHLVEFFDGSDLKVWRNFTTGRWTFLRYDIARGEWGLHKDSLKHPLDMPYKKMDINARHEFKHIKNGKDDKRIYYRGYNTLLDQQHFEEFMREGCYSCKRIPEWGNYVVFVSQKHDFLCEHCDREPGLTESLQNFFRTGKMAVN